MYTKNLFSSQINDMLVKKKSIMLQYYSKNKEAYLFSLASITSYHEGIETELA